MRADGATRKIRKSSPRSLAIAERRSELSSLQYQIASMVVQGMTSSEISAQLAMPKARVDECRGTINYCLGVGGAFGLLKIWPTVKRPKGRT